MRAKPSGLDPVYAAQFQDQSVVDAYHHRPPYPEETFEVLQRLIPLGNPRVLDLACGTGDIARPLAQRGLAVDAVDISEAMIAKGKQTAAGDQPNLRWICARVEDVHVAACYGLVTAGESLHWMTWETVLPRLCRLLDSEGYLVILDRHASTPWDDALQAIIDQYSTNLDYQPYNLLEELVQRHLYAPVGEHRTLPLTFEQPVDAYIESFHSRNGFSRQHMGLVEAAAFDHEVRALSAPWNTTEVLRLELSASLIWGKPLPGRDIR